MAAGAVIAAAGVAVSVAGQLKAAKDQKRAAQAQADARRAQADEILQRSELNIQELERQAETFKERQAAAFASSGVDIGSGAPLVTLENTNRVILGTIENRRREASYRAEAALRGASISEQTGRDIEKAGQLGALGTGLAGLGQALSNLK